TRCYRDWSSDVCSSDLFIAISGFALSASALVGQNLGARQGERARQAVRMTVSYCLVVTLTTAVAFMTVPRALVGLFTADPAVIRSEERRVGKGCTGERM